MTPKVSMRVIVTLPRGIYAMLEEVAAAEGRAVGNLAGYVLEEWIRAEYRAVRTACSSLTTPPSQQ